MTDLLSCVGTRPNLIKLAPLVEATKKVELSFHIYDTCQHYDPNMQYVFYQELSIPPSTNWLADPKIVIVIGDTNSAADCAVEWFRKGYPIAHVEAGCRCGRDIPEELNRKVIDSIAKWNFCSTENCIYNCPNSYLVGDVLYDLFLKNFKSSPTRLGFALVTIHRQENTKTTQDVFNLLNPIADKHELVLFPKHPRIPNFEMPRNVLELKPVGYKTMLHLLSLASHVYTDSGGLQREAYWSETPFTLLRNETEWPELFSPGNNAAFGDGHAAEHIMKILKGAL